MSPFWRFLSALFFLTPVFAAETGWEHGLLSVLGTAKESLELVRFLWNRHGTSGVDPQTLLSRCCNSAVYEFFLDSLILDEIGMIDLCNAEFIDRFQKPDQQVFLKLLLKRLRPLPYKGAKFHFHAVGIFRKVIKEADFELVDAFIDAEINLGDEALRLVDMNGPHACGLVHRLLAAGATISHEDTELVHRILRLPGFDLENLKLARKQGIPYWMKPDGLNLFENALAIGRLDFALYHYCHDGLRITGKAAMSYPYFKIKRKHFAKFLLARSAFDHSRALIASLDDPNSNLTLPVDLLGLITGMVIQLLINDELLFKRQMEELHMRN